MTQVFTLENPNGEKLEFNVSSIILGSQKNSKFYNNGTCNSILEKINTLDKLTSQAIWPCLRHPSRQPHMQPYVSRTALHHHIRELRQPI